MGRFAKRRLTAEERHDRQQRNYMRLRWIKGSYLHNEEQHGAFRPIGDEELQRLLHEVERATTLLIESSGRHAKQAEDAGQRYVWRVERPVDPDDVLLGKIHRAPHAAAPLRKLNFSAPLAGALVVERIEKQPNVHDYLVALRNAVAVDAPVVLVVANAHYELIDDNVNLFTAGTLAYALVRAGWSCRDADFSFNGRHIIVRLRRSDVPEPWPTGVDACAPFMPFRNIHQFCSGEIAHLYRPWLSRFAKAGGI